MPRLEYVTESSESEELLESLCQPVREWFKDRFPDFTEPQKMAIPQIMGGTTSYSVLQQAVERPSQHFLR